MIVDAVGNVGAAGLWVGAVLLGGFNDGQGPRERFSRRYRPLQTASFPPCHCPAGECKALCREGPIGRRALGGIVVDGDTPVSQKQAEGPPLAQAIAEGTGQVILARNAQKLMLWPGKEGRDLSLAQLLTRRMGGPLRAGR